jgi:hypothetical protein
MCPRARGSKHARSRAHAPRCGPRLNGVAVLLLLASAAAWLEVLPQHQRAHVAVAPRRALTDFGPALVRRLHALAVLRVAVG